ncbi:unnamed protein product, partial [marine sediment metagenome]
MDFFLPEKGLSDLLEDAIEPTEAPTEAREGLWLLAGSRALAQAKRLIARRDIRSGAVLSEALEVFEGHFDFV